MVGSSRLLARSFVRIVSLGAVGVVTPACGGGGSANASTGTSGASGATAEETGSGSSEAGSGSGDGTTTTADGTGEESGDAGETGSTEGGTGNTTGVPEGGGVGDACDGDSPCREGLDCVDGVCVPGGNTPQGAACVISGECAEGLQCVAGYCEPGGAGSDGDGCESDADCADGYRCGLVGFASQCVPEGEGDFGTDCSVAGDCYSGLTCLSGTCAPVPPGLPPFSGDLWPGVECAPPSSDGVRAFFEVPGVSAPMGQTDDFFRLPFPNDVMMAGGRVDYGDFPRPGGALLGFDPVDRYIEALEAERAGWGGQPVVIFRFSGTIDLDTFASSPGVSPVRVVDITPGDPAFGSGNSFNYWYETGRSKYVCHNWMGVRRGAGSPLVPGHTYAYLLTTDGKAAGGGDIERSEHLVALLSGTAPSDPALAAAHAAYEPLRDYLAAEGISPDTILNASVVTAGAIRDPMTQLAAAVQAEPVPSASAWVKCGGSTPSPCPDAAGDRACGSGSAEYDEYHALVDLPIFQSGDAPYLTSGGAIASSPVRTESVCLSMTVPTAVMPAGGWPAIVYAHGTTGSFRSHVRPEVAGALVGAPVPGGGSVDFVVLGIDQVAHGPRRGVSSESPENLFFNVQNPDAALGNPLQAAADQLSLARFASALDIDASTSGGDAIRIDPTAVYFFGHSQGALAGALATPFTESYGAVVLSGHGGSTRHAVLEKQNPTDIAAGLPFVLQDFDATGALPMGEWHPALTLLQHWVDPSDAYQFARVMVMEPPAGTEPQDVFVTYGQGDTYTPNTTALWYARAARLGESGADASVTTPDDLGLGAVGVPLIDNRTVGGITVTAGVRQYAPEAGADGHFVAFDLASANADIVRFLAQVAAGQRPQIGP